jgi:hypothetical protein
MKNYKLSDLLHDYDCVNKALDNLDNRRVHISGLNMYIKNFELKYSHLWLKHREYFLEVRAKFDILRINLRVKKSIENEN